MCRRRRLLKRTTLDVIKMTASPPFLGFPDRLAEGRIPRVVIFGAGHGSTYPDQDSSGYALAADAIRAASQDDAAFVEHWDFDLGGPLFDGKPVCCIDVGDIPKIALTIATQTQCQNRHTLRLSDSAAFLTQ